MKESDAVELLVIGAGPGGYGAAIRAAQLGQKVTIVESDSIGGVCLNRGCIPSKALISASQYFEQIVKSKENKMGIIAETVSMDFNQLQKWKQDIVTKLTRGVEGLIKGNNISIINGKATFKGPNSVMISENQNKYQLKFNKCIIATGSQPIELSSFPFGDRILSSTEVLQLKEIPKSLVVIGGGYIGVELSQVFSKLGTKITIIEGKTSILPNIETSLSKLVQKNLESNGVDVFVDAIAEKYIQTEENVIVVFSVGGKQYKVKSDYIFVAVGRKPNLDHLNIDVANIKTKNNLIEIDEQCQTSNQNIFAIGDVTKGPQLAHKASYEGKVAAEAIAGQTSFINYRAIPAVVFSDPEIATVGLTESEAKQQGIKPKVGKFSYSTNGRALSLNRSKGFVKVISDEETGEIIGGQIVGSEASNLIAEITLAIEMGCSNEDLALTIHAHPTLSELIMEASEDVQGMSIHNL